MTRHLFLAAVALVSACSPNAPKPPVSDAWVRLPAVSGRPAAGYFTLVGDPAQPRVLVGVESPSVQRIELHESMKEGGHMTMRPIARVPVADQPVAFAPGGRHLMLFGMPAEAKRGGLLPLVFRFADGSAFETRAVMVGAGDPAP